MQPGGTLLVNSSLINVEPKRTDVKIFKLAANDIAVSVGNPKAANMAILGAYVALSKTVTLEQMQHAVEEQFANKKGVIPGNVAALKAGYEQTLAAMEA
jgi:2-oxoglutarate ferredoxin oxidoreductase subunit gamma